MKFGITALLLVLTLCTGPGIAQSLQPQSIHYDTLMPPGLETGDSFCDNLVVNCLLPNCRKGYMTGNNRYGLREVLMKFRFSNDQMGSQVLNAFIRVGRKVQANAASATYAVFYAVGPDGYPDSTSRILSSPVNMGQLRDGVYQRYSFAGPASFADSFFVGLVLPVTAGDTIGVFQTPNRASRPCAAVNDTLAYERGANGSFGRMYDNWQVVFELAIQADIEYQGLSAHDRLQRLIQLKPNPAPEAVAVQVSGEFGPVSWQLVAADGRVARRSGQPESGSSWRIERGGLPPGLYLLRLETRQGMVLKRFAFQ